MKIAFHLPLFGNRDAQTGERPDITPALTEALASIFVLAAGYSVDGFWQKGEGTYRMKSTNEMAADEYVRYFVVFDRSCTEAVDELTQILRSFAVKARQESIYMEIQKDVEVRFIGQNG